MKEHPILMTMESVRAILDGRKTQTRRIINPQPFYGTTDWHSYTCWNFEKGKGRHRIHIGYSRSNKGEETLIGFCPYGQVGDRLWVKETYRESRWIVDRILYKADGINLPTGYKWKSSRFMFKKYARIWLEITGVRVERLQEISIEDIKKEGAYFDSDFAGANAIMNALTPKLNFIRLWDSLNAKRGYGWSINPWVWVIEFRRLS